MGYDYCVEFVRYYAGYYYYVIFRPRNTSASSRLPLGEESSDLRCGHLLWMPTLLYLFVPFPT